MLGMVGDPRSVHIQRWSAAMAARGHTVVPIDLSGRGRSALGRVAAFVELRRAMARVARSERGVIVVHGVPDGFLATGMRGLHPIVLHAWGADVTTEGPGLLARVRGRQLRGLFRAADAITATSQFLADTVRRRFGLEATVVPFGIDLQRFRPATGKRRPGPIRVGFVKVALDPKYGPDVLIEALGRLPSDCPFEVLIAGDAGLRATLEERVKTLGLGDRVRFLGRLPHSEIAPLLADLDIFAMPSRREEWGVAAAEASATGLPVVASRVGGIPEIVVDGETGILVPPEDPAALASALATLFADVELRSRYGEAGRRKIEAEYRWESCVDRMESVYAGVVSRPGRA
jgi:glycosyltransferase involved in cell wall biosynthesis